MFDIPVKIEGVEKRRRSVGMFHILAGLFLVANASLVFKYLNYSNFWTLLPVFVVAVVSIYYGVVRKRIDTDFKYNRLLRWLQFSVFLVFAIILLRSGNASRSLSLFLWAGICLALLFAERFISSQPAIKISNEGISAPGSFSIKKIYWNMLESVIVRKDYITLNYTNNQYLQFEISGLLTGTEIERINMFCSEKLGKLKNQNAITGE